MQFHGCLVQQYRVCVVVSLGLGITCLISLYYVYKGILILFLLMFMPSLYSHSILKNLFVSSHF